MADNEAFTYNGGKVEPGETQDIRYGISETYLATRFASPSPSSTGSSRGRPCSSPPPPTATN